MNLLEALEKGNFKSFLTKKCKCDLHWHSNYCHFEVLAISMRRKLSMYIRATKHFNLKSLMDHLPFKGALESSFTKVIQRWNPSKSPSLHHGNLLLSQTFIAITKKTSNCHCWAWCTCGNNISKSSSKEQFGLHPQMVI